MRCFNESSPRTRGPIRRGPSLEREGRYLLSPRTSVVMGPCFRRDDELKRVVPANAGTHTPRPVVRARGQRPSFTANAGGWVPAFAGMTNLSAPSRRTPGPIRRVPSLGREGRHLPSPRTPVVIGPCFRRDDELKRVVPANAGTHTPRRVVRARGQRPSFATNAGGWVPAFAGTTNLSASSRRTPGPIRRGPSLGREGRYLLSPRTPVATGPCFRRDDELKHVVPANAGTIRRGLSLGHEDRDLPSPRTSVVMGPCFSPGR
jgi:hypothetical protein